MNFKNELSFALELDEKDNLSSFRNEFYFPQHNGKNVLYFCGNSLGLQPKKTAEYIIEELEDWKKFGVEGHFRARHPWFSYHEFLRDAMARVVGANPVETVVMNSLTVNLHLMMVSFYRPTKQRYKIICEWSPFPSDMYALQSQVKFQGFEPDDAILELKPEEGKYIISTEKILQVIEENKDSLALIMIGGVNYYTGQYFDMQKITEAAHRANAIAGFDLAHAAGNIDVKLHDWNVDFAVWCSYKYLNSGPGSAGCAFVHERYAKDESLPRFAGWWGNDPKTRFTMPHDFKPTVGADSWQLSNAPVFSMAAMRASLELFDKSGMKNLRNKSEQLTAYTQFIIEDTLKKNKNKNAVRVITPSDSKYRGCQLSLITKENGKQIHQYLEDNGVVADWRSPDVIRIAPVPLYNSFEDVFEFGRVLEEALKFSKTSVGV